MSNTYILVEFPEVQKYMEEDWFQNEVVLANDEDQFGSSAYMIPQERVLTTDKTDIESRLTIIEMVKELARIFPCSDKDIETTAKEWDQGVPFEGGMSVGEHMIDIKRFLK